ncbi:SDR family oxidoreductase [soil metagenome]
MSASTSTSSPSSPQPLAVVTGAGSGIGLGLTRTLLARGIEVVAIDLDLGALPADDARLHRHAFDVRDASAMAGLAASFDGRPASHVFANAGIGGVSGDVLTVGDAAWQWAWEVNVVSVLRTLRLWWPHLLAGSGRAVATASSAALQSFPGAGPYRATKAALLAAVEGLHYQSAGSGVSVHALCPGMVRSEIIDLQRFADFSGAVGVVPSAPNPFAAHVAAAMQTAEPANDFAERVLDGLEGGLHERAPFYWFTHPETLPWIEGRQRAIADGRAPFADFGAPA